MKKCIYNVMGDIIRDYESREVKKPKKLCTVPMTEFIACFPDSWSWKQCDEWFFKEVAEDSKEVINSFTDMVSSFKMLFSNQTYNDGE